MACESEQTEVNNAELSLDGAGLGLDQAIAVYSQAMQRLYAALQALAACKARNNVIPNQFKLQADAAVQQMQSMRTLVANESQQAINYLTEAPCPVEEDPEPEPPVTPPGPETPPAEEL